MSGNLGEKHARFPVAAVLLENNNEVGRASIQRQVMKHALVQIQNIESAMSIAVSCHDIKYYTYITCSYNML